MAESFPSWFRATDTGFTSRRLQKQTNKQKAQSNMSVTPKRKSSSSFLPRSEGKTSRTGIEVDLSDSPKTPRSTGKGRRGLWDSFNGVIVDKYSDVGSVGSVIVPTPGSSIILPSSTGKNSSLRILKRALEFPIPDKYKQTPLRSDDLAQPMTPDSKVRPIEQKCFYGNKSDTPKTSEELVSPPPKKAKVDDPTSSKKAAKPKSVLHRVAPSGKVTKKKFLKKKFGMNKGVEHAIRKPVHKKKKKVVSEKSESIPAKKLKKLGQKVRKISKDLDDDLATLTKPAKSPSVIRKTPKRGGKLSIAKTDSNVRYEIKNGQPVFTLRRSPRKHPTSPIKSPYACAPRKTPAKLFTPSGSNDYLGGSPVSKRRGPALPSPVRFDVVDAIVDEEEKNNTVRDLIDALSEEDDDAIPSQDDYTLFVCDSEIEQMASQTVNELEVLAQEDALLGIVEISHENVKPAENVTDTIKSILATLPPPTEDEIRAKRTPQQVVGVTPLAEIGNSPSKTRSPAKMFSIFEKGFGDKSTSGSGKKNTPKRKLASTVNEETDGKKQAVIDAGQKKIGAEHCLLCDFVYTIGDADEEKLHMAKHNHSEGQIKFPGWKNERRINEFEDGRIILIRPGDPKRHWAKAESVLEVVDQILGITSRGIRQPEQSKIFMFISDAKVVGFLLSETIAKTDQVSLAVLNENQDRVLEEINPNKTKNVMVGISRIWVEPSHQRKSIATRLVHAMRFEFLPGKYLKASEFAFTHTTQSGSAFASKYIKQQEFLVYTPSMEGTTTN